MKKITLTLLALTLTFTAWAQDERQSNNNGRQYHDDGEMEYLVGHHVRISGFGALLIDVGSINNDVGSFVGGGGGIIFDNAFFIGGYAQGLTTRLIYEPYHNTPPFPTREARLTFSHGGFWLGYSPLARRAIHPILSTKIGWGSLGWSDPNQDNKDPYDTDKVFVMTPQVGVEANVTRWFRVTVEGGYRFVSGVELPGLKNDSADGAFAAVTFRFGGFK